MEARAPSRLLALLDVTGGEAALFQILLVIILGGMERHRWDDLGDNRFLEASRLLQLLLRQLGFALLLRGVKKDRGAILRSIVRTLAVELGGIMVFPKHFQQLLVGKFRRIVLHFDCLGVAGAVAANILVGRIGKVAARVSNPGRGDTRQLAESGFNSPETACSKGGFGHMNGTPYLIIATSIRWIRGLKVAGNMEAGRPARLDGW